MPLNENRRQLVNANLLCTKIRREQLCCFKDNALNRSWDQAAVCEEGGVIKEGNTVGLFSVGTHV